MRTMPAENLKANSRTLLGQLKKEKAACLTDAAGKAMAYLVSAETFDGMQTRLRLLEGIARGERAIREGRVFTQAQARKKMSRWLKK